MKIVVVDNYDSFTFNIVQLLGRYRSKLLIAKNDDKIDSVRAFNPDKILLSPGPGRPENSGLTLEVIRKFGNSIPILGVCLGMQAMCYLSGAEIVKAKNIYHGKTSTINHDNKSIFKNLPQNFEAMRYHSLVVDEETIPGEIEISAKALSGEVMAIRHKYYPLEGIQFHPESVLTPVGKKIIKNWLYL